MACVFLFRGALQIGRLLAIATVAASLLVACGGGVSDSTATVTPVTPVPPVSGGNWPVPSYSAQSEELVAYNTFNKARVSCGFGYLQQNLNLDRAAFNHVVWQLKNNLIQHLETPGTVAYTGTGPWDRMLAAGYTQGTGAWQWNEVVAAENSTRAGFGLTGAVLLLGAPYHLAGLMQSNREMGISVKTGGPMGSGAGVEIANSSPAVNMVADMAANNTYPAQLQSSADVLTYPCAGVVGTITALYGETPSPIPSRNLATNPIGQPVFVQVRQGQVLTITSSSIVKTTDSSRVPLAVTLTSANDPNSELSPSQAILIPNAPMAAQTQYTVTIQGTNNGTPFVKNFTFTTGT